MTTNLDFDYGWSSAEANHSHAYLWPPLLRIVHDLLPSDGRIFEVGAGNGATAKMLVEQHHRRVTGIEPSAQGLTWCRSLGLDIHEGSAYDDLAGRFGTFPLVYSLEVVEHCFWPHRFAKAMFDLTAANGWAVISTPYHGYWKNLAIAAAGGFDAHVHPLVDGGHIKFFSEATMTELLRRAGFVEIRYLRVGRAIPALAKSLIALARRGPAQ
jgi:SAM-dependent methyltransferase